MPGVQGRVPTPRVQTYTMEMEPTLFVDGPGCTGGCDPDRWNPLRLRREGVTSKVRGCVLADRRLDRGRTASSREEVRTGAGRPLRSRHALHARRPRLRPAEAGQHVRLPARSVVPVDRRADARLSLDRRRRELARSARSRALATATASGNRPGGSVLPFYARNFTNLRQWIAPVAPRRSDADDSVASGQRLLERAADGSREPHA